MSFVTSTAKILAFLPLNFPFSEFLKKSQIFAGMIKGTLIEHDAELNKTTFFVESI